MLFAEIDGMDNEWVSIEDQVPQLPSVQLDLCMKAFLLMLSKEKHILTTPHRDATHIQFTMIAIAQLRDAGRICSTIKNPPNDGRMEKKRGVVYQIKSREPTCISHLDVFFCELQQLHDKLVRLGQDMSLFTVLNHFKGKNTIQFEIVASLQAAGWINFKSHFMLRNNYHPTKKAMKEINDLSNRVHSLIKAKHSQMSEWLAATQEERRLAAFVVASFSKQDLANIAKRLELDEPALESVLGQDQEARAAMGFISTTRGNQSFRLEVSKIWDAPFWLLAN
eukprot:TRINITY_DN104698_c0_g1_i1.p1 TRINITY_DN104698_c0_g1~~TRINITY_DN104698_c0_g1_i1.p1  ORF type:complete len:280 (-),score=24.91 TRINITY_DN104698_c0_g1_i1:655-1494(-)